jgi:hypothetical protein
MKWYTDSFDDRIIDNPSEKDSAFRHEEYIFWFVKEYVWKDGKEFTVYMNYALLNTEKL